MQSKSPRVRPTTARRGTRRGLSAAFASRLSGLPGDDALVLAKASRERPKSARASSRKISAIAGRAMAWIKKKQGKIPQTNTSRPTETQVKEINGPEDPFYFKLRSLPVDKNAVGPNRFKQLHRSGLPPPPPARSPSPPSPHHEGFGGRKTEEQDDDMNFHVDMLQASADEASTSHDRGRSRAGPYLAILHLGEVAAADSKPTDESKKEDLATKPAYRNQEAEEAGTGSAHPNRSIREALVYQRQLVLAASRIDARLASALGSAFAREGKVLYYAASAVYEEARRQRQLGGAAPRSRLDTASSSSSGSGEVDEVHRDTYAPRGRSKHGGESFRHTTPLDVASATGRSVDVTDSGSRAASQAGATAAAASSPRRLSAVGYRGIVLSGAHNMAEISSDAGGGADDERSMAASRARLHGDEFGGSSLPPPSPVGPVGFNGSQIAASSAHSGSFAVGSYEEAIGFDSVADGISNGGQDGLHNDPTHPVDVGSASRADSIAFRMDRTAAHALAEGWSEKYAFGTARRASAGDPAAASTSLAAHSSVHDRRRTTRQVRVPSRPKSRAFVSVTAPGHLRRTGDREAPAVAGDTYGGGSSHTKAKQQPTGGVGWQPNPEALAPKDDSVRFLHDVPIREDQWNRSFSKRHYVDRSDPSAQVYSRPLEHSPLRSPAGVSFVRSEAVKAPGEVLSRTAGKQLDSRPSQPTKPVRGRHSRLRGPGVAVGERVGSGTIPAYAHRATSVSNERAAAAGLQVDDRLTVRSVSKASRQLRKQAGVQKSASQAVYDEQAAAEASSPSARNSASQADAAEPQPSGAVSLRRTMTSIEAQTRNAPVRDRVAVQEYKPALEVAMACTVTGPTAPVVRELRRRIRTLEYELLASEHVAAARLYGLRARLDQASGYEGKQSWSYQESDEVFKRLDSVDVVLQDMEGEKYAQLETLDEVAGMLRDVDKLTKKMIKKHKPLSTQMTQTDDAIFSKLRYAYRVADAAKRQQLRKKAIAETPQPLRLPLQRVYRYFRDYAGPPLLLRYFAKHKIVKDAPGAVSGLALSRSALSRSERIIPLPKLLELFDQALELKSHEDVKSDRQGLPRIPFWRGFMQQISKAYGSGSRVMNRRHLAKSLLTAHRYRTTCRLPPYRRRLRYLGMDRACVCGESQRAFGVCACGSSLQSCEYLYSLEMALRHSLGASHEKYRSVLGLEVRGGANKTVDILRDATASMATDAYDKLGHGQLVLREWLAPAQLPAASLLAYNSTAIGYTTSHAAFEYQSYGLHLRGPAVDDHLIRDEEAEPIIPKHLQGPRTALKQSVGKGVDYAVRGASSDAAGVRFKIVERKGAVNATQRATSPGTPGSSSSSKSPSMDSNSRGHESATLRAFRRESKGHMAGIRARIARSKTVGRIYLRESAFGSSSSGSPQPPGSAPRLAGNQGAEDGDEALQVNDDLSNLLDSGFAPTSISSGRAPQASSPESHARVQAYTALMRVGAASPNGTLSGGPVSHVHSTRSTSKRGIEISLPEGIELTADGARSSLTRALTPQQLSMAKRHNVSFIAVKKDGDYPAVVPAPPAEPKQLTGGRNGVSRAARVAAKTKAKEDAAVAGLLDASAGKVGGAASAGRAEAGTVRTPSPPPPRGAMPSRFPPLQTVGEGDSSKKKKMLSLSMPETSDAQQGKTPRPPAPPRTPKTPRAPTTPRRRPQLHSLVVPDTDVGSPLVETPAMGHPETPGTTANDTGMARSRGGTSGRRGSLGLSSSFHAGDGASPPKQDGDGRTRARAGTKQLKRVATANAGTGMDVAADATPSSGPIRLGGRRASIRQRRRSQDGKDARAIRALHDSQAVGAPVHSSALAQIKRKYVPLSSALSIARSFMRPLWRLEWDGAGGLIPRGRTTSRVGRGSEGGSRTKGGRRQSHASSGGGSSAGASDPLDFPFGPHPGSTRSRRSIRSQDSPTGGGRGFGQRQAAFDFENIGAEGEAGTKSSLFPSSPSGKGGVQSSFADAMAYARAADSDEEKGETASRLLRQAGLHSGITPGLLEEGVHPASTQDFCAAARDDWAMVYHAMLRHASLCRRRDGSQSMRLSMKGGGGEAGSSMASEIVPVTVEEALDRLAAEQLLAALTRTRKGTIKELFSVVDVDGDGYIEVKEFQLLISALGLGLKPTQIQRVMRSLDKNLDGRVSFAEFAGAFRERQQGSMVVDMETVIELVVQSHERSVRRIEYCWRQVFDDVDDGPPSLGSRSLSQDQLGELLHRVGVLLDPAQTALLFKEAREWTGLAPRDESKDAARASRRARRSSSRSKGSRGSKDDEDDDFGKWMDEGRHRSRSVERPRGASSIRRTSSKRVNRHASAGISPGSRRKSLHSAKTSMDLRSSVSRGSRRGSTVSRTHSRRRIRRGTSSSRHKGADDDDGSDAGSEGGFEALDMVRDRMRSRITVIAAMSRSSAKGKGDEKGNKQSQGKDNSEKLTGTGGLQAGSGTSVPGPFGITDESGDIRPTHYEPRVTFRQIIAASRQYNLCAPPCPVACHYTLFNAHTRRLVRYGTERDAIVMRVPHLQAAREGTDIAAVGLVPIAKLLEPESSYQPTRQAAGAEASSPTRAALRVQRPSSSLGGGAGSGDASPLVRRATGGGSPALSLTKDKALLQSIIREGAGSPVPGTPGAVGALGRGRSRLSSGASADTEPPQTVSVAGSARSSRVGPASRHEPAASGAGAMPGLEGAVGGARRSPGRPSSARPSSATRSGQAGRQGVSPARLQRPTSAIHRRESSPSVTWSRDVEAAAGAGGEAIAREPQDRVSITSTDGGSIPGKLDSATEAKRPVGRTDRPMYGRLRSQSPPVRPRVSRRSLVGTTDPLPLGQPPAEDLLGGMVRGQTMHHGMRGIAGGGTGGSPLRRPQSARAFRRGEGRTHWQHGSGAAEAEASAPSRPVPRGTGGSGGGKDASGAAGTGSVGGWTAETPPRSGRPGSAASQRPRSASPRGREALGRSRSRSDARDSLVSTNMLELDIRVGLVPPGELREETEGEVVLSGSGRTSPAGRAPRARVPSSEGREGAGLGAIVVRRESGGGASHGGASRLAGLGLGESSGIGGVLGGSLKPVRRQVQLPGGDAAWEGSGGERGAEGDVGSLVPAPGTGTAQGLYGSGGADGQDDGEREAELAPGAEAALRLARAVAFVEWQRRIAHYSDGVMVQGSGGVRSPRGPERHFEDPLQATRRMNRPY